MTKLEQKLAELGYEENEFVPIWEKNFLNHTITLQVIDNKIIDKFELINSQNIIIKNQSEIDNIQQAFNEMQKDLEVLKECEEK